MSQLTSKIVWKFNQFEPNTIWAAQKQRNRERITNQELNDQQNLVKKLTLNALTKNIDPFSLIHAAHDFLIMDKKKKQKREDDFFHFSSDAGFHRSGSKNQDKGSAFVSQLIDRLNNYLISNWEQLDRFLPEISKDNHPLAKDLWNYLSTAEQIQVFLVGYNPVAVQRQGEQQRQVRSFYAIKFYDRSSSLQNQINDNIEAFTHQKQQQEICKFIIFNKQKEFFLLDLNIKFEENISIITSKKMECVINVKDHQNFFKNALSYTLTQRPQLFKNYEFSAKGDYIEYPFKQSIARKRKLMKQKSYSLAFQGGGAKGVAYVGSYKAIKQTKNQGQEVPITSIMGSSAGGIIALAVSTNIDPYEVQKICYKMGTIPRTDRIDRKYLRSLDKYRTDEKINQERDKMLKKLIKLLDQYGIIQRELLQEIGKYYDSLDKKKVAVFWKRLIDYLLVSSESIGQIFDFRENDFQEFNALGLLLEGALMKGQAIHDIGSQVLVKFALVEGEKFFNQAYKESLGSSLSKELKEHVQVFDSLCQATLEIPLQRFRSKQSKRLLFSIINKIFMIIDRNVQNIYKNEEERFVLDPSFAETLLRYFEFSSIYDKEQSEFNPRNVSQKCVQLYRILFNHHKIHPKSFDMGRLDESQKETKRELLTEFLKQNNQVTYEYMSQLLAEEYFLDPLNFSLRDEYKQVSLRQFLSNIFKHGIKNIFQDKLLIREVAQIINQTLSPEAEFNGLESIVRYNQRFESFKKSVQKITLSQYYKITKIELTCTSVDLDNKVLRFFNQKTTPYLPVCRAVQMTGSFPVGFKAQTWKEQWGNYYIHYESHRRQIILKGHEFTDGGMLANFPIKYFDNNFIRDVYFSHVINRHESTGTNPYETIMLGFGLDKLTNEQYTPGEGEIYRAKNKQTEVGKASILLNQAIMDLVGYSGKLSLPMMAIKLRKVIDAFRYPKKSQIQWKMISSNLINDIPLLSFGFKLLEAYPRADRNLNLECFNHHVYRTKLLPTDKSVSEQTNQKIIELRSFIDHDIKVNNKTAFSQKKSIWQKSKDTIGGWFSSQKQIVEDVTSLNEKIEKAIHETPLNYLFNKKIHEIFQILINKQNNRTQHITVDEAINSKRKIKDLLLRIISNRIKLEFHQTDIQLLTLEYLFLRYSQRISSKINEDLTNLSKKKFNDQILKRSYDQIETELPFEDFKKEIFKSQIITKNQYDPKRYTEEQLQILYKQTIIRQKQQLIDQKIKLIQKLSEDDKKEYLNLDSFLITQNDKFLIQFIFLSKLQSAHLEHGNNLINKVSVNQLLTYFEKGQDGKYHSYITIKDLKAFYRILFSKKKNKLENKKYDPITLLEPQQVFTYQYQQQLEAKFEPTEINLPNKFNDSIYLDRKITTNEIYAEMSQIQQLFVQKIEFVSILRQVYSSQGIIKSIQNELLKLINANPDKYNKALYSLLYPGSELQFQPAYFKQLLAEDDIQSTLIRILFNKDGQYYSENQHILKKYNERFQLFKTTKLEILGQINKEIKKQVEEKDQETRKRLLAKNSISAQVYYLYQLQQRINYQLLIAQIQKAKNIDYYLKNADLSTGMGKQTDKKQRQAIRDEINSQQSQKSIICDEMIAKVKLYQANYHTFELYYNQIRMSLEYYCMLENNEDLELIKYLRQTCAKMEASFISIREWLTYSLNQVIQLPIGSIQPKHIKEAYSLDYFGIKDLFDLMFKTIHRIDNIQNDRQFSQLKQVGFLKKTIPFIFSYFNFTDFKLPNFEVVWKIYKAEFQDEQHSHAILRGLNSQFTNTFVSNLTRLYKQINQNKKEINKIPLEVKVHLIMEGSDLSNNYYGYYYQLIQLLKNNLKEKNKRDNVDGKKLVPYQIQKAANLLNIRAITTSSYHSIFGFLIALNYNLCHIKNEMREIREIAEHLEPKKHVQSYFDSYQWTKVNSQEHKQFWSYIKQEKYNVFKELQKLTNKSLPNLSLTHEFEEIRSIYEHEQEKVLKYCQDILDDMSEAVGKIDQNVNPCYKALEISKKYAFNYTCNLRNQHQYAAISKTGQQLYQKIVNKLFYSYGSLLEGIITNSYTSQIKLKLPNIDSGLICKGFIIKQLLTTFKIKEFVIKKLKQNNFRENITLSEFFCYAPVKVLLNFTTINVHKARLEFMNKNTLPNMPVWAAIVSASTLPYFYRDFECPREWQYAASDTASLYEITVDDFFKSNNLDYKKAKYISGNMISSLPLELLTNQTTLSKMLTFQIEGQSYLHIGYAFDSNQGSYQNPTLKIKRNYLQLGIVQAFKLYWNSSPEQGFNKNCGKVNNHKNKRYEASAVSAALSMVGQFAGNADFTKYLGILTESNDNFILHAYWDRLVRLPIKIDTLDFHEITNTFLKSTYGADVASEKTKNTVERSYEITKYFSRKQFGTEQNRYELNFRVSIIQNNVSIFGEEVYVAKIELLSHSKWNRNKYNNFLLAYSTNPKTFNSISNIAIDSEMLWNVNQSSKIYVRFFFPIYTNFKTEGKYSSIAFSQFELDISNIVNQLPLKNSYDYTLNFHEPLPEGKDYDVIDGIRVSKLYNLHATHKNMIPVTKRKSALLHKDEKLIDVDHTPLKVRSWSTGEEFLDENSYIRPLR